MGRYRVGFVDNLIRDISISCQKWIDRHFGLAYCVKSLYKVALEDEKQYLMGWMIAYRKISLLLLKALVYIFDRECDEEELFEKMMGAIQYTSLTDQIKELRCDARSNHPDNRRQVIETCMNILDRLVEQENRKLEAALKSERLSDTQEGHLSSILRRWKGKVGVWALINDPNLNTITV